MKKIIILTLCLVMLFAMTVPASAEGSIYLSISASSNAAYRGETITFYISASGGGTCDRFGLALGYDTSVFEYVGGSYYVPGAAVASMDSSGLFAAYNPTGSPSGTVGTFTLRVRSDAPFVTGSVWGSASAGGAAASASGTSVTVYCDHSYGEWQKCTVDYHQKVCSICGGTQEEWHAWNEGTLISAPSCKDEGSMTYTCTVCGEIYNETLPKTEDHNYGAYQKVDANDHQATCSICSTVLTQPHTWDGGVVTLAATCKSTGTMRYTCMGCGDIYDETIPVSETHSYGSWVKVDDATHQHTCTVCQKKETVEHAWNGGSVTKKPNCTETGTCLYTCNGCGTTKTEEMDITGIHTYDHGCDTDCNICGETRTTVHDYSYSWSKNAYQHWYVCYICGAKEGVADHIPGPEATEYTPQYCTVCEYILQPELTHEHSYYEELTTDEEGHWYACYGCEDQKDYAKHDFDNDCDGLCETCGYTRQTEHNISEEWFADADSHFQKCLSCEQREEEIPHQPGPAATELEPQICEICGFELVPAMGHSFREDWSMDELTHYHLCDCGEKADVAEHTWVEESEDSDGIWYRCTICDRQKLETKDTSWLRYVILAVALVAIGAVVVLILIKRRNAQVVLADDLDDAEDLDEAAAMADDGIDMVVPVIPVDDAESTEDFLKRIDEAIAAHDSEK